MLHLRIFPTLRFQYLSIPSLICHGIVKHWDGKYQIKKMTRSEECLRTIISIVNKYLEKLIKNQKILSPFYIPFFYILLILF